MFWLILLPSLLAILVLVYKVLKFHDHWKERDVPFESSCPFFGELARFVFGKETFPENITRVYNHIGDKRYSGIYQFLTPLLFLKDPDLIKEVAVKNFDHFTDHREFLSPEVDTLFGRTMLSQKGEQWHKTRTTLSPAFTSSKMKFMFGLITDCADQFIEYLEDEDTTSLEMKDLFSRFTNDVIANAVFGVQCNSLKNKDNEFYRMMSSSTQISGWRALKLFVSSCSPSLSKMLKLRLFSGELEEFFRKIVREAIKLREDKGIVRPDMMHLMIQAKKGKLTDEEEPKSKSSTFEFTDEDIVCQSGVFVLAGFDTSSTLLSYAAHELAINEDAQRRLQAEIDETLEKFDGELTYEALFHMKYLDMVLSEVLRKYPPIPVTDRACVKDGYVIEAKQAGEKPIILRKGDIVLLPIYALQMDPNHFEEPAKFDPDRFSAENKTKIKQGSYMPFGMGPRNCLGSRFALMESKVVLFYLLSKFDVVPTEKTQIPIKQAMANVNMGSERGFWLGLKRRNLNTL